MRYEVCEECSNEKPVNEIFIYNDKKYCNECLSQKQTKKNIPDSKIYRLIDDTICTKSI